MDNEDEDPNTIGPDVAPSSPLSELENGIFNMVITMCHELTRATNNKRESAYQVANYLERLAAGLKTTITDDQQQQGDN